MAVCGEVGVAHRCAHRGHAEARTEYTLSPARLFVWQGPGKVPLVGAVVATGDSQDDVPLHMPSVSCTSLALLQRGVDLRLPPFSSSLETRIVMGAIRDV